MLKRLLLAVAFVLVPVVAAAQAAPFPLTVCCQGSTWSEGLPTSNSAPGVGLTATSIVLGGTSSIVLSSGRWTLDSSGFTAPSSSVNITLNTNKFVVTGSTGAVSMAGTLTIGTNTASAGTIRMANTFDLRARNAANSGDVFVLTVDASNILGIGNGTGSILTSGTNLAFTGPTFFTSGNNVNVGAAAYTGRGTTNPTNAINIYDGTAPVGAAGSGFITLYSTAGELRVMDSGGVATLLSPHDHATGKWIYDSIESSTGRRVTIQMEDLAKWLDAHYGTKFVKETAPPSPYPKAVTVVSPVVKR